MARKSVFSLLNGKRGKYQIKDTKTSRKASKDLGHMDGKYRQTKDEEPPQKKRKTEGDSDDELWDDDGDFTQADLDNLDLEIQASQSFVKDPVPIPRKDQSYPLVTNQPIPSTSAGHVTAPIRDSGRFLKPQLSRSSSSSSNGKHQTSHNSSSHSSHSSYPGSLSDYTGSSSSIKSGSSSELNFGQRRQSSLSVSRGVSSESLDVSGILGRQSITGLASSAESDGRLKQELAAVKLQMEKLKEELCVKEGENRLLRDNLGRKDSELEAIKMEKVSQINIQNKQQSDREKNLLSEVAKLQTQLEFKNQEERELAVRCRELESQLENLKPLASSSQVVPFTQTSPKPRKVLVSERSPKGHSTFPTKQSFMATEASPVKRPPTTESGDNQLSVSTARRKGIERKAAKLRLKLSESQRQTGVQLVARLLEVAPSQTGSISERGIVGLLSTPSTSTSIYNTQFDRDRETSLLSPVRNKRLSDFHSLISREDRQDTVVLVPPEHFHMAMQGLSGLLRTTDTTPLTSQGGGAREGQQLIGSQETLPHESLGQSNLDNAILVLPIVNDYLQHYLEMFETVLETTNTSSVTASSSSSESFDASSGSPSGSFGMLLKNTANCANDLEGLAIAALQTLYILVSCDGVRQAIMYADNKDTSEVTESSDGLVSTQRGQGSRLSTFPMKHILKLNLLRKIIRLSNPGAKVHLYNTRIVNISQRILETMATHCQGQEISCLLPVLREECIQNCLEGEGEAGLMVQALRLLKALTKANQVVSSLCTSSAGCVLLSVYNLCISEKALTSLDRGAQLSILQLVIETLSYIASCHKGGLSLLLESDCECSVEVVKCVVCILHKLTSLHKESQSSEGSAIPPPSCDRNQSAEADTEVDWDSDWPHKTCLAILQEGLLLLHLMSEHEMMFSSRHQSVQHQYVQTVCDLSHLLRHSLDNNESEMMAIQDLWDFNQDDSELSQDSETEDNETMDTS